MPNSNKILLISSLPPSHSAGLGQDVINALTSAGYEIEVLTKYRYFRQPKYVKNVLGYPVTLIVFRKLSKFKVLRRLVRNIKRIIGAKETDSKSKDTITLYYPNEKKPQVAPQLLLSKINGDYKAVITLFWEGFINSESLNEVYDKLKCPILIYSVDMAPMTGGCFYFKNCRNFKIDCRNCPAMIDNRSDTLKSDQPHINYLTKKENYSNMNCAFLGNSWMNSFVESSHIFDDAHIFKIGCIINENDFYPKDQSDVRKELGLSDKNLILFTRSSSEPRKGCDYLINSVSKVWNNLSEDEKSQFVVVTIGDDYVEKGLKALNIPCNNFNLVNREKLIKLYQTSTYFLSPSTDDAGPSMVNQSIMCGCPVVCFNIGTAIDVIEDGKSGFKSDTISQEGFDNVLQNAVEYYRNSDLSSIRESSRRIALNTCSAKKFVEDITHIYKVMTAEN